MSVSTTANSTSLLTPSYSREKGTKNMPIQDYFGGHGEKVMSSMQKTYGADKAKQVFYATANKMKSEDNKVKARVKGQQRAMMEGSKMKG